MGCLGVSCLLNGILSFLGFISFLITLLCVCVQKPVAHNWTKLAVKKKTFCNICRKKVSSDAWICEGSLEIIYKNYLLNYFSKVCKYYCHTSCKAVAFNNCKECATYSYGSTPSTDTHHWIEGNLHSGARCQICTKSCASTDCLTGFRCGWCGISVSNFKVYRMCGWK